MATTTKPTTKSFGKYDKVRVGFLCASHKLEHMKTMLAVFKEALDPTYEYSLIKKADLSDYLFKNTTPTTLTVLFVKLRKELSLLPTDSDQAHAYAKQLMTLVEKAEQTENIIVLDPVVPQKTLTDRAACLAFIEKITEAVNSVQAYKDNPPLEAPASGVLRSKEEKLPKDVSLPIVVKPLFAEDHQCGVLFEEKEVLTIGEKWNYPVVVQSYVPHDSFLIKLTYIGGKCQTAFRGSIPLFREDTKSPAKGDEMFTFLTKEYCKRSLTEEEKVGKLGIGPELMQTIADMTRKVTNCALVGLDLILNKDTGKWVIIDVNHFPSYVGANTEMVSKSFVTLVEESLAKFKQ